MATHSNTLTWEIPWSLESYSPWGCKRVGHDLATEQYQWSMSFPHPHLKSVSLWMIYAPCMGLASSTALSLGSHMALTHNAIDLHVCRVRSGPSMVREGLGPRCCRLTGLRRDTHEPQSNRRLLPRYLQKGAQSSHCSALEWQEEELDTSRDGRRIEATLCKKRPRIH